MMQGYVRPLIGAGLVAMGLWMIWQRARGGWKLVAPEHKIALGEET
jgi:hypothetical protein